MGALVLGFPGGGHGGTVIRLALLALAYVVYFSIYGGLALWVSALARTSRSSLVILVGLWGLFCLIAPRVSSELSVALRPLPSEAALKRNIAKTLEMGIDGKTERESAIDAMVKDLMAEKGFANTGMLVADAHLTGLELQAEAKWEDDAYDHHVTALNRQIQAQENAAHWLAWVSPYLAMRALSAGLSGTDFAHHRDFTEYAETWRKAFVRKLNETFAEKAGAQGWDYRAGAELWKQAPPFTYREPSPTFALQHHWPNVFALLFWLAVALFGAHVFARRVRVV
ncbi:MAG: DUF3526 domain-containing protein [Myxococcota bacterium]|nr:DUF3526 domain-containing protein [Myxococcota bacterium]